MGGGSLKIFSRNFFCLTVSKASIGESLGVSLISATEKLLIRVGGEYQNFPSKVFCLRVPKKFVEQPFCAVFQKIPVA